MVGTSLSDMVEGDSGDGERERERAAIRSGLERKISPRKLFSSSPEPGRGAVCCARKNRMVLPKQKKKHSIHFCAAQKFKF
jgi:hypothetical protein